MNNIKRFIGLYTQCLTKLKCVLKATLEHTFVTSKRK